MDLEFWFYNKNFQGHWPCLGTRANGISLFGLSAAALRVESTFSGVLKKSQRSAEFSYQVMTLKFKLLKDSSVYSVCGALPSMSNVGFWWSSQSTNLRHERVDREFAPRIANNPKGLGTTFRYCCYWVGITVIQPKEVQSQEAKIRQSFVFPYLAKSILKATNKYFYSTWYIGT